MDFLPIGHLEIKWLPPKNIKSGIKALNPDRKITPLPNKTALTAPETVSDLRFIVIKAKVTDNNSNPNKSMPLSAIGWSGFTPPRYDIAPKN
jgi:hypothetical protein